MSISRGRYAEMPVQEVIATNQNDRPVQKRDGSIRTVTHTAATVAAAQSAVVLAANTARKYALFINDSDAVVYLKIGAAAVSSQGIRLNANGGSYEMSFKNGNLHTGAVNGIVVTGAIGDKVLLVTEGV
jgi:bifunctional ADP-heptose synthase (sugar kinase/adenylyltransferase)